MTGPYEWKPFPHIISIRCPNCSNEANFEFVEVVNIDLKKDVDYFKKSKHFDYQLFEDNYGQKWHGAIFYKSLNSTDLTSLKDLPDGYTGKEWDHSKNLSWRKDYPFGTAICSHCNYKSKHELHWPHDSYFKIEFKGSELWAFNKEMFEGIKSFIESKDRKEEGTYSFFYRYIPTLFKESKNREMICKKINKILGS